MDRAAPRHSPSLRLPSEICSKIHRCLLSTERAKRIQTLGFKPSHGFAFHTTVLCVHHQVHHGSTSILDGEHLVIYLTTNAKELKRFCNSVGLRTVSYSGREVGMHRKLAEYSKLAFRQTLASKEGQGRDRASERAAKELRTAVDFEPGDSTMKKELGILEGEVGVKCERDLTLSMEGLAMWIRRL